ncbi:acylneuraminate cytidylyltransferase [[Actinobacillus] muris]|uniref:Acylneuraminate cytidylyltransferase n=1 Tax=Muribacter muris TaxID=67855 RepID=A0A0J5P497_9PAST|nr:GDSL-type esterase/lipase family protein [Muribacter muris]KMK51131.1 acylneuraminate cytidylyltransferase [[Actinobacillus] muris] [Muribacter muris]
MKKIAIITARSGSKGLPNKNVLLVNGKPLMAYSIEAAIESAMFDKIIVSTDSQEYIDLLSHYPIDFIKRAEHLAGDKASSFVVIEDVLQQYHALAFDYFMLLQPTSPLRTATHIREACEKFEQNSERFDFLVSVSDAHKPTTLTRVIEEDETLKHFQLDYSNYARQQYHPEYSPNGAIFVAKPTAYLRQKHFYGEKCLAYFMDKAVSVDIDDRLDFDYFYFLIQQQHKEALLLENIRKEIHYKQASFHQPSDITFIGHSQLAQWYIESLNGQTVNNLAISGITATQYRELILQNNAPILGDKVVIWLGINDLRRAGTTLENAVQAVSAVVERVKQLNPNATLYCLECLKTVFRVDCDNRLISEFNRQIQPKLAALGANFVPLNSAFEDGYGKLNPQYSNDGLHLNAQGYTLLQQMLEKVIQ